VVEVRPRPPLHDRRLRADRVGVVVQPHLAVGAILKAGRLDHQRVAVPGADGVAQIPWLLLGIARAAIQPHPPVPAQRVKCAEPLRRVQDLEGQHAGQQARDASDDATGLGVDGLVVRLEDLLPLRGVWQREARPVLAEIAVWLARLVQQLPVAGEQRLAVRAARRHHGRSVVRLPQ
jgi:hypothetical protein